MVERWRIRIPDRMVDDEGDWVTYTDHIGVIGELVGILDDLVAQQNGPPLLAPRHRDAWQKVMDKAEEKIKEYEELLNQTREVK